MRISPPRRAGLAALLLATLALVLLTGCADECPAGGCIVECLRGDDCNLRGRLEELQGHRVLFLEGTHYQMGYTTGKLLATDIIRLVNEYAAKQLPILLYNYAREEFPKIFTIPEPFLEEYQGIYDGLLASGVPLRIEDYNKDLDLLDIQIANAMSDIGGIFLLACSSLSAWGEATGGDPEVPGELFMARNMDWEDNQHALKNDSLIVAYRSSLPGERPWISITFPGIIGCISCMNDAGVVATQNVGPGTGLSGQEGCVPINLSLRKGIEQADFDGDGRTSAEDVVAAVTTVERAGGSEIHLAQPLALAGESDPAFLLEVRHREWARRVAADEPEFGPSIIAATNHHRKLTAPINCWRYEKMRQLVVDSGQRVTRDSAWQVEREVTVKGTLHTMIFTPGRREMWLAFTTSKPELKYSTDKTPARYLWSDFFPFAPDQ